MVDVVAFVRSEDVWSVDELLSDSKMKLLLIALAYFDVLELVVISALAGVVAVVL